MEAFPIRSRYRRFKAYRTALRKTLERIRNASDVVCELDKHAPVVRPTQIRHPDFEASHYNWGNRPRTKLPPRNHWIEAKCLCGTNRYWVAIEQLSSFAVAARRAEIMEAAEPQVKPWWRRA